MRYPLIVFCWLFLLCSQGFGQNGFDPNYRLLHSSSYIQDKNFYLLTLLEKVPSARLTIEKDEVLQGVLNAQKKRIQEGLSQCDTSVSCWINAFNTNPEEQKLIGQRLGELCKKEKSIQALVQQHLRPSGAFMKYAEKSDAEMLQSAWTEACGGIQYILNSYALGKRGRYASIDSASYAAKSLMYKRYLMVAGHFLAEKTTSWTLFHQPATWYALTLMDMNNRDEAARHEPMEALENQKALEYIPNIEWSKYPYSVILQPGHGPDIVDVPLSPMGKFRVQLVADRFHKGMAPLIILSGGYVHPFQTPYAEATEMKKALMEQYGVPERAIIIDPHARHTTTNFRNGARLIFRYGIPADKMALCTSTMDQIVYITDPKYRFKERNMLELGYLPYELFAKISSHDVEFKPQIISLHLDPLDPLDP